MQQIAPEVWLPLKDQFIFRIRTSDTGSRWTFRVPLATLEALNSGRVERPQAVFDLYRPKIYAAAARLVETGDARRQQTISENDITKVP